MELENGRKIPQVGFGTWPMKGEECFDAVCSAIKVGYRHIDTAYHYQNEAEVGRAINFCISSGLVEREDIFLTTKSGFQSSQMALASNYEISPSLCLKPILVGRSS